MISEVILEAADVPATHRDEIVLPPLDVEHSPLHRGVVGLDLSVLLFGRIGEHVVGDLQQGLFLSRRIESDEVCEGESACNASEVIWTECRPSYSPRYKSPQRYNCSNP
jgi:hypothetical protein